MVDWSDADARGEPCREESPTIRTGAWGHAA
jgi:hypothetical protein